MKIEGNWYKELKQSEAGGSFWTRGTKINVGVALFVVSLLTLAYVGGSGYLGYNDSDGSYAWSSNEDSFIKAGNNSYNVTFADLQTACDLGVEVKLPSDCNITVVAPGLSMSKKGTKLIGWNSTLFLAAGSNCDMITVSAGNISITGVYFNMNNYSQTYGTHNAIYLDNGAWDTHIFDCSFIHGVWHLINTASSSGQGRHIIESNRFYSRERQGYGGAICVRGAQNIVRNNIIKDTWGNGVCIEGSASITYDNIVDGNIISGAVAVGIYNENRYAKNTTIVNNIITNINSTAYIVSEHYYSIGILSVKGCIIANNQISGVGDVGIYSNGDSEIIGNKIYNVRTNSLFASSGSGIVVVGYATSSNFTIISSNKISYTANSGIVVSANASISSCIIRNITGANNRGIEILGTGTVVSISDCRIENISSSAGIHVEGTRARAYISHCIIRNIGQRGIYIVKSTGGIIEGNSIEKTGLEGIYIVTPSSKYVVNNNWVNNSNTGSSDGIRISASNITVTGNIITTADEAIELDGPASNVSATGNRAYLCNSGFFESGACKYNSAESNNFRGCTVPYTIVGTGSYAMYINGTTAKIAIVNSGGTTWK